MKAIVDSTTMTEANTDDVLAQIYEQLRDDHDQRAGWAPISEVVTVSLHAGEDHIEMWSAINEVCDDVAPDVQWRIEMVNPTTFHVTEADR